MDYKLLSELSTMAASLKEVATLFALTDDQMKDPACGRWLVDRIKQMQTSYTIRKEMSAKVDFPKAQNPGLPPTDTVSPIDTPRT